MTRTESEFQLRVSQVKFQLENGQIDQKQYRRQMNKLNLKNPYSTWSR